MVKTTCGLLKMDMVLLDGGDILRTCPTVSRSSVLARYQNYK